MKARLGHGFGRKNVVVEIGDRVGVAGLSFQGLGQTVAAAKLPQVFRAAQLVKHLPVVGFGELVIDARGEDLIASRRIHRSDERRDHGVQGRR